MDELRRHVEALRQAKIHLETKLGHLHQAVNSRPAMEVLKAELDEAVETRRRKQHLFKTDTSMLGALDGLVRAIKHHKEKERMYLLRAKNLESFQTVQQRLAKCNTEETHILQRLDGLSAVRQRIVDEQSCQSCEGAHIISARPGGSRCTVRCVSAPPCRQRTYPLRPHASSGFKGVVAGAGSCRVDRDVGVGSKQGHIPDAEQGGEEVGNPCRASLAAIEVDDNASDASSPCSPSASSSLFGNHVSTVAPDISAYKASHLQCERVSPETLFLLLPVSPSPCLSLSLSPSPSPSPSPLPLPSH